MLADVGIAVMNDASFFGPAKAVYVCSLLTMTLGNGGIDMPTIPQAEAQTDRGIVKWHDIIGHYYSV
jgi:hypothetical protein